MLGNHVSPEMAEFFSDLWAQRMDDRLIAEEAVAALAASDAHRVGYDAGYAAGRRDAASLLRAVLDPVEIGEP